MCGWVRDVRVMIIAFWFSVIFGVTALHGEEITAKVQAETFEIITLSDATHEIRMENFGNLLTPGQPMLPYKSFLFAIPFGAEVISVEVNGVDEVKVDGNFKITPAPMVFPMNLQQDLIEEAETVYQKNKQESYSADQFYPADVGWYDGEGQFRDYKFVRVAFCPFSYNPVSEILVHYPKAEIIIQYSTTRSIVKNQNPSSEEIVKSARRLLQNYEVLDEWYPKPKNNYLASGNYNYVIITTNALESSVSSLVNWKTSIGFSVAVKTVEWINNNYTGSDLPEKIRNFLIDKYGEWGIEYVLLVGDVNNVPMRICYPKPNTSSEATPTDYYYADLTGNWDSDGDSRYGEYGQDNVDWVAEVYVGRIPWSDGSTVSDICDKLVNFESNRGSWKKNALLLGAMSNYQNEDNRGYSKTDGAALMEIHKTLVSNKGGSSTTMYEKAGVDASSYSCDQSLTHNNVVNDWSNHNYGMVNWWAHGSKTAAYRKWWDHDDGDGVPESGAGEMKWQAMISSNDCSSLPNSGPIIFACSCNNGYPESSNLGKDMIRRGSSGIVASSRVSWYSIGWRHQNHGGNASMDYYFYYYLINHDDNVGEALYNSKVYYANHFMYSSWGWVCWQNMFDFNLYGDPALYRLGKNAQPSTYSISGTIKYHSSDLPVNEAQVEISGGSHNSQTTGSSGTFTFESLQANNNFDIDASKSSGLINYCIIGYDAALTARIAVGMFPNATDNQQIAADVDKNGSVQMYDASLIAQYAVGLTPNQDSQVGEWTFNPGSRYYNSLNSNYANQDFRAIILGDVDGNWSPGNLLAKHKDKNFGDSVINTIEVLSKEQILIPLKVTEKMNVLSFDATLTYDENILEFVTLEKTQEIEGFQIYLNKSEAGRLRLTGFALEPKNLQGCFLELAFNVVAEKEKSCHVNFEQFRINQQNQNAPQTVIHVGAQNDEKGSLSYKLFQNYPNPFNPETKIDYQLPELSNVKLCIYNTLGQKIRTLVDEKKAAGHYQAIWNGKDDSGRKVTSGLYVCKLEAGNYVEMRKMALMK